jgi:hypothetical protein
VRATIVEIEKMIRNLRGDIGPSVEFMIIIEIKECG